MYLNTFNFDFDSLKNLPKLINYVGAEPTIYESNSITLRFSKSQDNIEEPPTNNCSETDSALINLIGFKTKSLIGSNHKSSNISDKSLVVLFEKEIIKSELISDYVNKKDNSFYIFTHQKNDNLLQTFENTLNSSIIADTIVYTSYSNYVSILVDKQIIFITKQNNDEPIKLYFPLFRNKNCNNDNLYKFNMEAEDNNSNTYHQLHYLTVQNSKEVMLYKEDKTTKILHFIDRDNSPNNFLKIDKNLLENYLDYSNIILLDNNEQEFILQTPSEDTHNHLYKNASTGNNSYGFYTEVFEEDKKFIAYIKDSLSGKYNLYKNNNNNVVTFEMFQFYSILGNSNLFPNDPSDDKNNISFNTYSEDQSISITPIIRPHHFDSEVVILKSFDKNETIPKDTLYYIKSDLKKRDDNNVCKPPSTITLYYKAGSYSDNIFNSDFLETVSIPNKSDFKLNTFKVVGIDKVYEDLS